MDRVLRLGLVPPDIRSPPSLRALRQKRLLPRRVTQERVGRADALRMYTVWAAYLQFAETDRGSIEAGKLADLLVLDRDFLKCPEDEIGKIEPVMMILNGVEIKR